MQIDTRFYRRLISAMSVGDLAVRYGCGFHGDPNKLLTGFSTLNSDAKNCFGFFDGKLKKDQAVPTTLGVCIVKEKMLRRLPKGVIGLSHQNPRFVFAEASKLFFEPIRLRGEDRTHPSAIIHPSAILAPGVVTGEHAKIGANTYIGANSVIGPGVTLGENCNIGANTSIFFAYIGNGLKLFSGARIGEAGFGVTRVDNNTLIDTPHFGRVLIGKDCTIGANSTIDRGMIGDTIIGDGNKLDNLVHIAHNSKTGQNLQAAAYAGVAGSCTIGDNVMMGGAVGLADHVKLGDNSAVMARAGLMHDVPNGEVWGGFPAKPARKWLRETAWLTRQTKRKLPNPAAEE